ncbi:MAG TPA: hypothetical protein VN461_11685 [Vicinamibacteria bacterium]|nr:hypothetical protein [Vicinamibacteria bacterium]
MAFRSNAFYFMELKTLERFRNGGHWPTLLRPRASPRVSFRRAR